MGQGLKAWFSDSAAPPAGPIELKTHESLTAGTQQPGLRVYDIAPQTTDQAIDNWLDPHYAGVNLSVPAQNRLFLFLPGSYGKSKGQQLILHEALEMGYHVISLSYPNSWTVHELCRRSPDPDCHGQIRRTILQGLPLTDGVSISEANSIENRIVKLLRYLALNFASEGWSTFLKDAYPRWDQILVAGHSQGGGHAAMLAAYHEVARVVMLAAPTDFSKPLAATAPWITQPRATAADRYFGFSHRQDPGFGRLKAAWEQLGLSNFGPLADIDTQQTPFNDSHQLVTNAKPGRPNKYHGSIAVDPCLPKAEPARKRLREAWRYLLMVKE